MTTGARKYASHLGRRWVMGLALAGIASVWGVEAKAETRTFRDDFEMSIYNGEEGNRSWSGSWVESDPKGGGAGSGNIQVLDGHLSMNDYPDSGTYPSIWRCADLSDCSGSATLRFEYDTSDKVDPSDRWCVQIRAQDGDWIVLEVFAGQVSGTATYDIADYISAETCVRFQIENRFGGGGEALYIEWVEISSECQAAPQAGCSVRDDFETSSYGRQDGTQNWSGSWVETDPQGGGAGSGNINVRDGHLSMNDYPDSGTYPSIWRCADLSDCSGSATLRFEYDTSDKVDSSDRWCVQIKSQGGDWIVLEVFAGQVSGTAMYDITDYVSSETCVRFQIENKFGGDGEAAYIEWVELTCDCGFEPSDLCVEDTAIHCGSGEAYTMWIPNIDPSITEETYEIFNGRFAELADGTAHFAGEVRLSNGNGFAMDVTFRGRTSVPPPGSPKNMLGCFIPDSSDWHYYMETTGMLTGLSGTDYEGALLNLNRRGEAFQVGVGANQQVDVFGASGWFDWQLEQPPSTGTTLNGDGNGDFNFEIVDCENPVGTIGDLVWSDLNCDGIQDDGEPGLQGIKLNLWQDVDLNGTLEKNGPDVLIISVDSDANGQYLFEITDLGREMRDFFIEIDPSNFESGAPLAHKVHSSTNVGSNDTIDSDADEESGLTEHIEIGPGDDQRKWDFGFCQCENNVDEFTVFDSPERAQNQRHYEDWIDAICEDEPDYHVDFETGFTEGQFIGKDDLLTEIGMVLYTDLDAEEHDDVEISNNLKGSTPIGNFGAVVWNELKNLNLDFSVTPVDYVSFYLTDVGFDNFDIEVHYTDDSMDVFQSDSTGENCTCEEFVGITATGGKKIRLVRILGGQETGDYGLDNIAFGICCDIECDVVLACPPDVTIECDETTDPSNTGTPTIEGGGGLGTLTYDDEDTGGICPFVIRRTWKLEDECPEPLFCVQMITLEDTTAPGLDDQPEDLEVECRDDVPTPPVLGATDNCDGVLSTDFVEQSDGQTCPETITRTWMAIDTCGNAASFTQTIVVQDTSPPTIVGSGDQVVSGDENCQYELPELPFEVSDRCNDVTVVQDPPPGSLLQGPGTSGVNLIATDACGNSATVGVDIVVQCLASLGDKVFLDANADGLQDPGELSVEGVLVNLLDDMAATIASTNTDATGMYLFDNLPPGDYQVVFVPPAEFVISAADQGGDEAIDSDADAFGVTPVTTLDPNEMDPTIDMGIFQPASLGDFVWLDEDGDGIQDPGEPGFEGVLVELVDAGGTVFDSTITDPDGSYEFTGLVPGEYQVMFTEPVGTVFSPVHEGGDDTLDSDANPETGKTPVVILLSGDHNPTMDAGFLQLGAGIRVVKTVYLGHDGGASCPGEEDVIGASGAPVTYCIEVSNTGDTYLSDIEVVDNAIGFSTTIAGPLAPGASETVFAERTIDGDLVNTAGASGNPTDENGNDIPGLDNPTDEDDANVDEVAPGIDVSKTVYEGHDEGASCPGGELVVNRNGIRVTYCIEVSNTGDTYLSDIEVVDDDLGVSTMIVGPLAPGVSETVFAESLLNGNLVNRVNVSGNPTDENGNDIPNLDSPTDNDTAEVQVLALLGDLVWLDVDADGQQGDAADEPGISNVVVNLLDEGVEVDSTTTDESGFYQFMVEPGTSYVVEVMAPAGFLVSPQDQGDDATDNDIDPITGQTAEISIGPGEEDLTHDAGLFEPASLGDFVWLDENGDGIQDPDEVGVEGVLVELRDADGTVIDSTTTGPDGLYAFTDLVSGDYQVVFTAPLGTAFSPMNQGGGGRDSDANPATGETPVVTLAGGENNPRMDAGIVPLTPAIAVTKSVYLGHDGGASCPGVERVVGANGAPATYCIEVMNRGTTYLSDIQIVDNEISFSDMIAGPLAPGASETVFAERAIDGGLVNTVRVSGNPTDENGNDIPDLEDVTDDDTAEVQVLALLGDLVWLDVNADGQQGDPADEPGISNVVVNLLDEGVEVDTATTDEAGFYQFMVEPGTSYVVEVMAPAGFLVSPQDLGDDATDSDIDPITGQTDEIAVGAGDEDRTYDAGFYEPVRLGDYVWIDTDGNGLQGDPIVEPGVSNVTVSLLDVDGNVLGTTTTDEDGFYLFDDLLPGTYSVKFDSPVGFVFTTSDANGNANDDEDSDVDPTTGETGQTILGSGDEDLTLDGGVFCGLVIDCPEDLTIECSDVDDPSDLEPDVTGVATADGCCSIVFLGHEDTVVTNDCGPTFTITRSWNAVDACEQVATCTQIITVSDTNPPDLDGVPEDLTVDCLEDVPAEKRVMAMDECEGEVPVTFDERSEGDCATVITRTWSAQDSCGNGISATQTITVADTIAPILTCDGGPISINDCEPTMPMIPHTVEDNCNAEVEVVQDPAPGTPLTGGTEIVTITATDLCGNSTNCMVTVICRPVNGALGNYVWEDLNGDGTQDEVGAGLFDVTVNLYDDKNDLVGTTTTDTNGFYVFDSVLEGNSQVEFIAPPGLVFTDQDGGTDERADSDADIDTGRTEMVNLACGETNLTVDAGFFKPAVLGDHIWLDTDANGVQGDPIDEPGVEGVVVHLLDGDGNSLATTNTDVSGTYEFLVAPGTYIVEVVAPDDLEFTQQNAGGDDSSDSDVNPLSGQTDILVIESGDVDLDEDAGLLMRGGIDLVKTVAEVMGGLNDQEPPVIFDSHSVVVYNFEVTNPGGIGITNVVLTDDTCGPVEFLGGDANADNILQVGEIWIYECADPDPMWEPFEDIVNVATVVGEDLTGTLVSDVDTARVATVGINVEKIVDADVVCEGTEVTFTLITRLQTSQPGFELRNIVVQDALCGPLDFVGGDVNGDGILQAGVDEFTNQCTAMVSATFTNVAEDFGDLFVDGVDVGVALSNRDSIVVTVIEPEFDVDFDAELQTIVFGSDATYTLTVTNTGTEALSNIQVANSVQSQLDTTLPDLAPGESTTYQGTVTNVTEDYSNEMTVSAEAGPGCQDVIPLLQNVDVTIPDVRLGNYVWNDINDDGLQGDSGDEPGIEGVIVNLLDDMGNVVGTTTTDENGFYSFSVQPGVYIVEFMPPAGFKFTEPELGGDRANDSDPDPITGRTATITVLPLQDSILTIDAGLIQDQPAVEITKLPDLQAVSAGDVVDWTITVRNTGNVDLADVTVTDPLAPDCNALLGDLAVGGAVTYTCTLDNVRASLTNVASVVGTPPTGPDVTDEDDAVVEVVEEPRLEIFKRTVSENCEEVSIELCAVGAGSPLLFRQPIDVMLVLDRSGSMIVSNKLQAAKEAAKTLIDGLDPALDRVGLATYSGGGTLDAALTSDLESVKSAVDALVADSITCIGCGVQIGQTELTDNGRSDVLRVMVVLTDGAANVDANGEVCFDDINPTMPTPCTEDAVNQAAIAKVAGSIVFSIGLSLDALDETFPGQGEVARDTMLAMATDRGKFFEAVQPELLTGIFEEVNQQIIGVAGTGVSLVEVLPDGLTYIDGSAIPEPTSIDGQTLTWDVGIVSVSATSCVTLAATVENPTENMLVSVFPDSRVDFIDFRDEPGSIPFPETREDVESCTVLLGNYVWFDTNQDGIQGNPTEEPPIEGVTVNLLDEAGAVVATATTGEDGMYLFDEATPGTHTVEFVLSDGFSVTTLNAGGDDAVDSDADVDGRTEPFDLVSGEDNLTIDAGLFCPLTLTCPEDIEMACSSSNLFDGVTQPQPDPAETGMAQVESCCGVAEIVFEDDFTENCGGTWELVRTWVVTDGCGRTAECVQNISVLDMTAPEIVCPAFPPVLPNGLTDEGECMGLVPDVTGIVSVVDDCRGDDLVIMQVPAAGEPFIDGVDIVVTVTDPCSNQSSCTVEVLCLPESVTCRPSGRVFKEVPLPVPNGEFDDGDDVPLPNVVVDLFRIVGTDTNLVESIVSGEEGQYEFGATSVGTYFVQVDTNTLPPGVEAGDLTQNPTEPFAYDPFSSEENCPDVTVSYICSDCELTGVVWYDADGDGNIGSDGPALTMLGINGATVRLVDSTTMDVLASVVTAPGVVTRLADVTIQGVYRFDGLPQGDYRVEIDLSTVPESLFSMFERPLVGNETEDSIRRTTTLTYDVSCTDRGVTDDRPGPEGPDFGFIQEITLVELSSFDADHVGDGVLITWETALEFENLGFNLYRSSSEAGARVRIHDELILGQGTGHGALYELLDDSAERGITYYYWLEDIDWSFQSTVHGPAVAGDVAPLATFVAESAGVYRISADVLAQAGLESLTASEIKILVNGIETPAYVTAQDGPLGDDDFVMIHVGAGAEINLVTGSDPARMEELDASPSEGQVWYGSATEEGIAEVESSSSYGRYVVIGFGEEPIMVLDVTDESRPKVFHGYEVLELHGELAAYFGSPNGTGARLVVVDDQGIRDLE